MTPDRCSCVYTLVRSHTQHKATGDPYQHVPYTRDPACTTNHQETP